MNIRKFHSVVFALGLTGVLISLFMGVLGMKNETHLVFRISLFILLFVGISALPASFPRLGAIALQASGVVMITGTIFRELHLPGGKTLEIVSVCAIIIIFILHMLGFIDNPLVDNRNRSSLEVRKFIGNYYNTNLNTSIHISILNDKLIALASGTNQQPFFLSQADTDGNMFLATEQNIEVSFDARNKFLMFRQNGSEFIFEKHE